MKRMHSFLGLAMGLLFVMVFGFSLRVDAAAASGGIDIYRLYNPNSGEHFYTTSAFERDTTVKAGWNYEGIGWVAPASGKPVYRVYNDHMPMGDHYYTQSKFEADSLVKGGWHWDNKAQPVFYAGGDVKIYVAYNPTPNVSGSHNYTDDASEQNFLLKNGWKFGAVAWMGVGHGKTVLPQSDPRAVDVNIVGPGGTEQSNPGSFRNLYANKTFDAAPSGTSEITVAADIAMTGTADGAELQFVLGGTGNNGQIGIELHNNASGVNQMPYWKAGINIATINFPQNAGLTGQQFYSSMPSYGNIAQGQTVHVEIRYYSSGIMQTYIGGSLVGQYKTLLTGEATAKFIVHATATSATISVKNLTVTKNGKTASPLNGTTVGGVTGAGVLY